MISSEPGRPRYGACVVRSERLDNRLALVMGLDRVFALHESRGSALGETGA